MKWLTPAEAAEVIGLPDHWDKERWVRARCKNGEIRGKQISRGVWRISEKALADYMEPDAAPKVPQVVEAVEPISFMAGVSARARKRVKTS